MVELFIDIETTGLEPVKGNHRVTFISVIKNDQIVNFYDEDEKKILTDFWSFVNDGDIIYTYNGDNFDIPFIFKRCIVNDVKMKIVQSKDIRKMVNLYELNENSFVAGTLNDWGRVMGMEPKSEDGLECIKAFNEKNWDLIKNHCEYDVKIMYKLFQKMKECMLHE